MKNPEREQEEEKETGRLEAFSDGIFAVAITLLVLEIKLPQLGEHQPALQDQIIAQWPSFLAYFISFITILIMWINHHAIFKLVQRTDHTFQVINGLLMLLITFVNYPTAVLAESLQKSTPGSSDQVFAAVFYSATFVLISVAFQALWHYATYHRRLLSKKADPVLVATIHQQYRFGPLFYVVALALAFASVWASVAVNGGLAVYFAFTGQITRINIKTLKRLPDKNTPASDHSSAESVD